MRSMRCKNKTHLLWVYIPSYSCSVYKIIRERLFTPTLGEMVSPRGVHDVCPLGVRSAVSTSGTCERDKKLKCLGMLTMENACFECRQR